MRTTLMRRRRPWAVRPCLRTSAKSRLALSRAARGNRSLLGFGVAGVMDFNTLRQQALASTLTTTAQDCAAAFGLHPRAEAELALARTFAGLIGALHILKNSKSGIGELGSISSIVKRLNDLPPPNHYPWGRNTPRYGYTGTGESIAHFQNQNAGSQPSLEICKGIPLPAEGIEPTLPKERDFESRASASSATPAWVD